MSRGARKATAEAVLPPEVFAVWPPGRERGEVVSGADASRALTAADVLDAWRAEHGGREVPRAVLALCELLGSGDLDITAVASGSEIVWILDSRQFYERGPEGPPSRDLSSVE